MAAETTGLYSSKEEEILNNNLDIRNKVIAKLTESGTKIPDNQNTLRVLDLFLTGSDISVHKTAENRTKHQAAQNTEEILEFVTATLRSVNNKNLSMDNNDTRVIDLDNDLIPLDTVEGETSLGITTFDVAEFIGEK